jgi:hypothetical protein
MLGRCCLCTTPSYYYSPSPSPPSLPSPVPYVGSCASTVCIASTFAKKWTFSWSPTWWTANAGQVACVNEKYSGSFTLNQRINSIHGLPDNPCAFDTDEVGWRWNNNFMGILPPTCQAVPGLPRFTFLIQRLGIGAANPGTNFVLYVRWQERHGLGQAPNIHTYYRPWTANKPIGAEQNCMGDIILTGQFAPASNPPSVTSGTTNNTCTIQQPGTVIKFITMSPAA